MRNTWDSGAHFQWGNGYKGCITSAFKGYKGCITNAFKGYKGCITSAFKGYKGCITSVVKEKPEVVEKKRGRGRPKKVK